MKTVLITGSSRGIGAETARKFAKEGWQVAINYNQSEEKAFALQKELGDHVIVLKGDVSDPKQCAKLVEDTVAAFGGLDALICNAGVSLPGGLMQDCTNEDWNKICGVNLNGVFYTIRAALPHMIKQQSGRIITVSSMWGQVGGSCEVAYSATKGAVIALTKALAQEVGPSHITVNSIAPGVIQTDMMAFATEDILEMLRQETPLSTLGLPADIAETAFFLAGEGARFITGQVLGVNGGMVIV